MPHAIRAYETGGPEVLRWEEVALDAPGAGYWALPPSGSSRIRRQPCQRLRAVRFA